MSRTSLGQVWRAALELVVAGKPVAKPVGRWAVGDGAGNAFRRADQGSWDNGAVAHRTAENDGFLLVVTNGVSPGYKATELGLFDTERARR